MTSPWALKIANSHVQRATKVRTLAGIMAAYDGEHLWLKGESRDAATSVLLASIADGPVFDVLAPNLLVPSGDAVPTETLPDLSWQPLRDLVQLSLPNAAVPFGRIRKARLQLVRSETVRPAEVLICERSSFVSWAGTAAEIRLHACRFAVQRSGRPDETTMVVVKGNPLPAIAGCLFWLSGNVAIPLGFEWSPAVDEATVRDVLLRSREDAKRSTLVIWQAPSKDHPTGCLDFVAETDFVLASRTNVRASSGGKQF